MDDVEIKSTGPEQSATQVATTQSSPEPEVGNGDIPNSSQETEGDYKQRYADSSREAKRLKEEADRAKAEAEEARRELLSTVTEDRGTFEKFINSRGLSPREKEYYMNMYDTQISPSRTSILQEVTGKPGNVPATNVPPEGQNPFRQSWMSRMDEQERSKWQTQAEASRNFFGREENKSLPPMVQESIKATALMLDQEFGYEPKEALDMARKRILAPEDIRDEGYAQGVKDAYQGGVSRGVMGGASRQETVTRLPQKDEAFVQLELSRRGLKGEDATKFREAYAARLFRK